MENEKINGLNDNLDNIDETSFHVNLSLDEKIVCLEEIISKLKKIIYVYEKSSEPNTTYNYRVYCGGILIYVSSSNLLFNGELISIVVNINAILTNNFDKAQIKRIVFESINQAEYMLGNYKKQKGGTFEGLKKVHKGDSPSKES